MYTILVGITTPILVGGPLLRGFRDTATLKNGQISPSDHGLYSPWSSKNLLNRNRLKKFMLVGIDVTCMHAHQFWWAWLLQFRR